MAALLGYLGRGIRTFGLRRSLLTLKALQQLDTQGTTSLPLSWMNEPELVGESLVPKVARQVRGLEVT